MSATPLRILVTGSRGWNDYEMLAQAVVKVVQEWIADHPENVDHTDWVTVVEGACPRGADALAHALAQVCNWTNERYPAQWRNPDGSKNQQAGFERNAYMVSLGADVCLCFVTPCAKYGHHDEPPHPSHGAQHCATLAKAAGIRVLSFYPNGYMKEGPP